MNRSFLQFSLADLDVLRRATASLLDDARQQAAAAGRRSPARSQHDSDAARYERGLRWIERARNDVRASRLVRQAEKDPRHGMVLALPGRARV